MNGPPHRLVAGLAVGLALGDRDLALDFTTSRSLPLLGRIAR